MYKSQVLIGAFPLVAYGWFVRVCLFECLWESSCHHKNPDYVIIAIKSSAFCADDALEVLHLVTCSHCSKS